MRVDLRRIFSVYFNSSYVPFVCLLSFVVIYFLISLLLPPNLIVHRYIGLLVIVTFFLLSLIGVFAAALWNFYRKSWLKGVINLLIFVISMLFISFVFFSLVGMFGPGQDNF